MGGRTGSPMAAFFLIPSASVGLPQGRLVEVHGGDHPINVRSMLVEEGSVSPIREEQHPVLRRFLPDNAPHTNEGARSLHPFPGG